MKDFSSKCALCGGKRGYPFDHKKCSEELKKLAAERKRVPTSRKILQNGGDKAATYFNKLFRDK